MVKQPWANSLCAVYAELIEHELSKPNPDKTKILEWLAWIKANCHMLATPKGITPPQLEPFLIKEGEGKGVTGTTTIDGRLLPRVAAQKRKSHP